MFDALILYLSPCLAAIESPQEPAARELDLAAAVSAIVVPDPVAALEAASPVLEAQGRTIWVGRRGEGVPGDDAARWLDHLVEEVDAVCVDIGWAEGEQVERWIHDGEGSLPALLDLCVPWSWDRAGAERVLRALRERCEREPGRKPRFVGVGVGSPKRAFERAQAFIEQCDFNLGHRSGVVLGPLRQLGEDGRSRWYRMEPSDQYVMRVAISEAYEVLASERELHAERLGAKQVELGLQSLVALVNVERSMSHEVEGGELDPHGDMIAGMVHWTRGHLPPAARVLCLVEGREVLRASRPDSALACFARQPEAGPSTSVLMLAGSSEPMAHEVGTDLKPRRLSLACAAGATLCGDLRAAAGKSALLDLRILAAARDDAKSGAGARALAARWSSSQEVLLATRRMADAADARIDILPLLDADFLQWSNATPSPR
jgi:hypothetical protein